jgi:hypothetical protein
MRVSLDPHSGMPVIGIYNDADLAAAIVETERTGVPVVRNTLRGFCRARMPSGVVLHDNGVHEKNGTWWVSPAAKPMLNRDGQHIKDHAGKPMWSPAVSFASKELRDKFSAAVLGALRTVRPEIFM